MQLKIIDRVTLLGILPEQGNFVTLKIVRKLRESLALSEEEIKQINFRQEGDQWRWDGDPLKDIEIGEKAADLIIECLQKLDRENKLTNQHFDLYDMFVVSGKCP